MMVMMLMPVGIESEDWLTGYNEDYGYTYCYNSTESFS